MSFSSFLLGRGNEYGYQSLPGGLERTQREARKVQRYGLNELSALAQTPVEKEARSEIERGISGLGAQKRQALRSVQQQIASRGLGATSLGMTMRRGVENQFEQGKQNLLLSLPERIRMLRQQRAGALVSGAGGVLGSTGYIPNRILRRESSTGFAPILLAATGAGLGGAVGGPAGAKVGAGAGLAAGSAISRG